MDFGLSRRVGDSRVDEFLSSGGYERRRAELVADIARWVAALESGEVGERRAAARALSRQTRAELGWGLLALRDCYASAAWRGELGAVIAAEPDAVTLESLLSTVQFGFDRFIVHPMWAGIDDRETADDYLQWCHGLAERVAVRPERALRQWAAYLFALSGDARAWDIYAEARPSKAAVPWLTTAMRAFGDTMSPDQRSRLCDLLGTAADISTTKERP